MYFNNMKKQAISFLLAIAVVISNMIYLAPQVEASTVEVTERYITLVLDVSGSMSSSMSDMKAAAVKFCESVEKANNDSNDTVKNQVALISYESSAYVKQAFTDDMDVMEASIKNLYSTGGTNMEAGLSLANTTLDNATETLADGTYTRSVLLFSDGLPQTGKSSTTGRYSYADSAYYYSYANEAYNTAESMWPDTDIYTLGFFESLSYTNYDFAVRFMADLANWGSYIVDNVDDLEFVFGELADDLLQVEKTTIKFPGIFDTSADMDVRYYYTDEYFTEGATVYNPSLATMSLCLELSAWPSYDTNVWANKTQNARALLTGDGGIGFDDFAQNEAWNSSPTADSIGVVAANKAITVTDEANSSSDDYTLIALAIRGGGYYNEWSSNAWLGETGEHAGFDFAKEEVVRFLDEYISNQGITGDIKLWLVGYSRSGAVANLVAGELNDEMNYGSTNVNGATLAYDDLYCYTFSPAQGADADKVDNSNYENIHSVINQNDIVPLVAPEEWGFGRYGNVYLLPSATTAGFSESKSTMLTHFNSMTGLSRNDYDVSEYASYVDVETDWKSIWPGGNKFVTISIKDNSKYPTNKLLTNTADYVAGDLKTRAEYVDKLETAVRTLLESAKGYGTSISDDIIDQLVEDLTKNYCAELITIISPMFKVLSTPAQKQKEVIYAATIFLEKSLSNYLGTSAAGFLGEVALTFGEFVFNEWQLLCDLVVSMNAHDTLTQAHTPEVALAWLMSFDPNYRSADEQDVYTGASDGYLVVRINCPVEVAVMSGSSVDSIRYNDSTGEYTVHSELEEVTISITPSGEKVIYLPDTEDYSIEIISHDDTAATVNVTTEVHSVYSAVATAMTNYEFDLADKTKDGTLTVTGKTEAVPVVFDLVDTDNTVKTTTYADPANLAEYTVTVGTSNEYGAAFGGGTFDETQFAQVEATYAIGDVFLGWFDLADLGYASYEAYVDAYANGDVDFTIFDPATAVSTDEAYRFKATKDITLIAHFAEGTAQPKYSVNVTAGTGGSVYNQYDSYPADAKIYLPVSVNENYVFDKWSVTSGDYEASDIQLDTGIDCYYVVLESTNIELHATFTYVPPVVDDNNSSTPGGSGPGTGSTGSGTTGSTSNGTGSYGGATSTVSPAGSGSSYENEVTITGKGTVTSDPETPMASTFVTLTCTPDAGYVVDSVTVTRLSLEKDITVTNKGAGNYEYLQPAGVCSIAVVFVEGGSTPTTGNTNTGNSNSAESTSGSTGSLIALPLVNKMTEETFSDVGDTSSWYYNSVAYVYDRGLMSGTGNAQFSPDMETSRGMIAQILYSLAGKPSVSPVSFSDVPATAYYADAVSWAATVGIAGGVGDNRFAGEDAMTREQLLVMLHSFEKLMADGSNSVTQLSALNYTDSSSVSSWATEATQWGTSKGLIAGNPDGSFAPQDSAERAQLAVILKNFVSLYV